MRREHVVAQVVVFFADDPGAVLVLAIHPLGLQREQGRLPVTREFGVRLASQDPGHRLVERVGIPPAIHVGLAEADGALGEDAGVEPLVVNLHIPRLGAVDLNAHVVEQLDGGFLELVVLGYANGPTYEQVEGNNSNRSKRGNPEMEPDSG